MVLFSLRVRKYFYYIIALPIYLLSWLPFPLLYLVSNGLYLLGYHMLGYRKRVVFENLKNSFPEKSPPEIEKTARQFYKHLADVFLETFKLLSISKTELQRRVTFANTELIEKYGQQKQNILIVLGHCGNWEWNGVAFQSLGICQLNGLYHPLSSPFFNWLMLRLRSRFGMGLIPMQSSIREMIKNQNIWNATAFIADQTPSSASQAHWVRFLNQDTAVFIGPERISGKFNLPVVYASVQKKGRGFYHIRFIEISDNSSKTQEGIITETFSRLLEEDIRQQPPFWLWSHRRWKHKWPVSN